jgi:xanthine dehydrogenase large subunit
MKVAGSEVPHESAREHVTGAAMYTEDLAGRFPGLLHAWPVTSPHAHAHVLSIDTAPAHWISGVVDVLLARDVPGEGDSGANRHDEPLFPDEVLFHGQPVAWVLAESRDRARAGAAEVRVEYEPLPAILTIDAAMAAGSFLNEPVRLARGDMSALERSPVRVDGELRIGGQEHFYLETQASIAWRDETGGCSVLSSTQHPSETQEIVARALALPRSSVTVECIRMGGAFGGKEVQANSFAAIAAVGAWKTRRPVMVRLTRALDMMLTGKRHPYLARYDAGFAADGRIEALRLQFYSDGGWSLDLSEPIMWRTLFHCENAYYVPAIEAIGRVCRTHKTSQTAFRGFGGPQGMLVVEEVMAQAARRLMLPPEVVRERNLYRTGQLTPYGQAVDEAERLTDIWTRVLETSDFAGRRLEIERFNSAHPDTKRGIAITPVKFGISFTATFYNQAGALVLVYRDGSVQVNHGGTEMGQGLLTKVAQIAADLLGVPLSSVRPMPARTDKVPNTSATAASSGTDLNAAAVADACHQIIERLRSVAADLLGCTSSAVVFDDGIVSGGGQRADFAAICERAYRQRVPLFAHGYYRTPEIHFDAASGRGKPFHYFAFGAGVSEVEIDRFTGAARVLRVDILEDVGDSISPIVDRGQVEGGFMQGLGWLTIEELLWDDRGRLMTAGASTYKLPSWSELPATFNVAFLERAAEPAVVFGSKAVGEPPLMLAISVREAIRDAVQAFNREAAVTFDSPATPERIFFAIQRARRPGGSLQPSSARSEVEAAYGGPP